MDPQDGCGCCEGTRTGTPVEVYNRPGLSAIAYRIGTHARFKRSMLARLSSADLPALRDLNTRDDEDFAIALLDAWATVADVLTFYSERVANESYLRTATERLSLLQLARLIGYELAPGVAANTHLAFEIEDAPGAPDVVTVGERTKVQSLPGQDELPQTFETVEQIEARPEWNVLRPRLTETKKPDEDDTEVYLKGVSTGLSPGDVILLVGDEREGNPYSERWDVRTLRTVTTHPSEDANEAGYTLVTWETGLGHDSPTVMPADNPKVFAFRQRAALFGHNAPEWKTMPTKIQRAYDPDYDVQNDEPSVSEWPGFEIRTTGDGLIDLDAIYPRVLAKDWILLQKPSYLELYRALRVTNDSRTDFALTAKTTRVELDYNRHLSWFELRDTVVYAQGEPLEISDRPLPEPVQGDELSLDGPVEGLAEGRAVIFSGEDEDGAPANETATLREATLEDGTTKLRLTEELAHVYRRDTLRIHANVARATHGETRQEVLGGGDASTAFQSFALREAPLTHTSAPTPSGTESSLEVRVNDVEWHEVPDLFGRGPDERVFVTRADEAGGTTVRFGDGRTGARLPTGTENVHATYRKGTGSAGLVRAGQLSLLMTSVLGVRSVGNPLAPSGAEDPEPQEEARRNAPLTVLTLDRAVSLRDYEDFARAYAGVAKALAAWVWTGEVREVFVTVAGPEGRPVGPDLLRNLTEAIRASGDRRLPLRVEEFDRAFFGTAARLQVDPDHLPDLVIEAVAAALRERFGFEARSFGQGVALSEVVAVAQAVPGVVMVDVDRLYRLPADGREDQPRPFLEARSPRPGEEGAVLPAELLMLDPNELRLEVLR